jgi:hypothetical protein
MFQVLAPVTPPAPRPARHSVFNSSPPARPPGGRSPVAARGKLHSPTVLRAIIDVFGLNAHPCAVHTGPHHQSPGP